MITKRTAWIILPLLSFTLGSVKADQTISDSKQKLIDQYIDLKVRDRQNGNITFPELFRDIYIEEYMDVVKRYSNNPDPRIVEIAKEEIGKLVDEQTTELHANLSRIYDRYFTERELKQLVKFYTSDVAKKVELLQPEINVYQNSVLAQWGEDLKLPSRKRVDARLVQEGLLPKEN